MIGVFRCDRFGPVVAGFAGFHAVVVTAFAALALVRIMIESHGTHFGVVLDCTGHGSHGGSSDKSDNHQHKYEFFHNCALLVNDKLCWQLQQT
jgi:hypothetical protein